MRELSKISAGKLLPSSSHRSVAGMSLVIVLAMLVLVLGICLAFFSKAEQQRKVSSHSAAHLQAQLISKFAEGLILDDIAAEIAAGSEEPPLPSTGRTIFQPIEISASGGSPAFSPSVIPQRRENPSIKNLLKASRRDQPFFEILQGYSTNNRVAQQPLARASTIATDASALRGEKFNLTRWLKPRLISADEESQFIIPDWIYVNRSGENPVTFSEADLTRYADRSPANPDYIIGRFAYAIYDVSGLLDVNSVGNTFASSVNQRRGRLNQVSLQNGFGAVALENFSDFLEWRDGGEPADPNDATSRLSPQRSELNILPGSQLLVTRQELLNYAKANATVISSASLPLLSTFHREVNAPHAKPRIPTGTPSELEAGDFNADPLQIQFLQPTDLPRPDNPHSLPSGASVMPRRFPLSKIALLSQTSPNAQELLYYFGLRKTGHSYEYVADINGRIAKLSEIAALGREPNFFETLQAAILTGSLGKSAGNTITADELRDEKRNLQIMQIGANIIDQWDSDDLPTTLRFPSGVANDWISSYGIENLPYLNNLGLVAHRPTYDRNRFQIWAMFDVWNPHQNANDLPQGITSFRIHPKSGRTRATLRYYFRVGSNPYADLYSSTAFSGPTQNISDLNNGHTFSFPVDPGTNGYSEPTILGSDTAPVSTSDRPGLLLTEITNLPPAIPATPDATLQSQINALVNLYKSSSVPANADYWNADGNAIFGVKAHNSYRLLSATGHPLTFELQALVNGEWRTYQEIDGFLDSGTYTVYQPFDVPPEANTPAAASDFQKNTLHGHSGANLEECFYGWRKYLCGNYFAKFDPRTNRFGLNLVYHSVLGTTIRQSAAPWPTSTPQEGEAGNSNWRYLAGYFRDPQYNFQQVKKSAFWMPLGLINNNPDVPLGNNNMSRYLDRDGVIRPADGYLGAIPTVPGRFSDRPLILNRPFRNVGELGHVFRDLPWKTLDFFTKESGDMALLDYFSIEETTEAFSKTGGKINLNTRHPEILATILYDTAKGLDDITSTSNPGGITRDEAEEIAERIVEVSSTAPLRDRTDLLRRILAPASATNPGITPAQEWKPGIKSVREAAIRTLAELGDTRTWNLMLDLVVQTGSFPPSANSGADFAIKAEQRYWIHLAIDRMTGEVIDKQIEVVRD